jgi:hypothetical protein
MDMKKMPKTSDVIKFAVLSYFMYQTYQRMRVSLLIRSGWAKIRAELFSPYEKISVVAKPLNTTDRIVLSIDLSKVRDIALKRNT